MNSIDTLKENLSNVKERVQSSWNYQLTQMKPLLSPQSSVSYKNISDQVKSKVWRWIQSTQKIVAPKIAAQKESKQQEKLTIQRLLINTQLYSEDLEEEIMGIEEGDRQDLQTNHAWIRNCDHPLISPQIATVVSSFLDAYSRLMKFSYVCKQWNMLVVEAMDTVVLDQLVSPEFYNETRNNRAFLYRLAATSSFWKSFSVNSQSLGSVSELVNEDFVYNFLVDNKNGIFKNLSIEYLKMVGCDQLNDNSFDLISYCPSLVNSVKQFHFSNSSSSIHDVILEKCITRFQNLQELTIASCFYVSSYGMFHIATKLPQLSYLDVSACNNVTNYEWLENLSNLKTLILRNSVNVTDEQFVKFVPRMNNVTDLDVSGCKITGTLCIPYMKAFMSNLKQLNLANTSIAQFKLDSIDVNQLPEEVQKVFHSADLKKSYWDSMYFLGMIETIEWLDLSGIEFDTFTKWKNLKNLKSINLSLCTEISGGDIVRACVNLPALNSINLSWCNIDDATIINVAKRYKEQLEELVLKSCKSLTPASVDALIEYCPNMRVINLLATNAITSNQISKLLRFKLLQTLNVANCSGLSKTELRSIQKLIQRKRLKISMTTE